MSDTKQQPRNIMNIIATVIMVVLFVVIADRGWKWLKNQQDPSVVVTRNQVVEMEEASKRLPSAEKIKAIDDAMEQCRKDWLAGKIPHRTDVSSSKRAQAKEYGTEYILDCNVQPATLPLDKTN